jgi:spore coat protein U-like protein
VPAHHSKPLALTIAVAALAAVAAPVAQTTQTRSATLQVTADVVNACQLTVQPLAFGAYDPTAANRQSPLDGASDLIVTCTKGTIVRLDLEGGQNPSGAARAMAGPGSALLRYDLFQEASRAVRWGVGVDAVVLQPAASAAPRRYQVFGRVAPGQDVPAGAYQDDVIVNLRF